MDCKFAERKWGVTLPTEIDAIIRIEPGLGVQVDGATIPLPWPPLKPSEIANSFDTASDWELPGKHIPVMGDFHNLVCLDYSLVGEPAVVILNDNRRPIARYANSKLFLQALSRLTEEGNPNAEIIEGESWLNF